MKNEITIKIPTLLFEDMESEWLSQDFGITIDKERSILKFITVLRERFSYFWPSNSFWIDVNDYYQDISISNSEERIKERIKEIIETSSDSWPEIIVLEEESLENYNKLFEAEMSRLC